jgi:predicted ATP-dependent serine protease
MRAAHDLSRRSRHLTKHDFCLGENGLDGIVRKVWRIRDGRRISS